MIVNVGSLFVSLEVYNYKVVFILCLLVSLVAWLFVGAIVETDQYHASTSPDITTFRQYYYRVGWGNTPTFFGKSTHGKTF